ncbi:MAG TPA: biopolymer transporter ExbD [Chitinophagales bacterium]|nr:biopolymer transporter ExbD [Chitinophagales bacterium]HRK28694.1 biopolymer transporter ExbD [Chitinophagales bacterium]
MPIKPSNKVSPAFSTASMTDIVFLLIIFFLLTSTFVNPNALNLVLPSSQSKTTVNQPLSISISADLKYYIGKQQVRPENLRPLLTEQLKNQPDPTIVLNAEKSVPIEKVVAVMDIANDLKVKMVLATAPIKE